MKDIKHKEYDSNVLEMLNTINLLHKLLQEDKTLNDCDREIIQDAINQCRKTLGRYKRDFVSGNIYPIS
jgi:hypothetical protein